MVKTLFPDIANSAYDSHIYFINLVNVHVELASCMQDFILWEEIMFIFVNYSSTWPAAIANVHYIYI